MVEFSSDLKSEIHAATASFTEREKTIIEARCMGERTKTLKELGEEFGVGSQTMRAAEHRLRLKLRYIAEESKSDSALGKAYADDDYFQRLIYNQTLPRDDKLKSSRG